MQIQLLILVCLCSVVILAHPVPDNNEKTLELVQIPLQNGKELDILSLANNDGQLSERNKRTIGILRELFPDLTKVNGENSIDMAALTEQLQETIRVARQTDATDNSVTENESNLDQQVSDSKSPAIDELTLDSEDPDGDDRNKRFLSFGFGGGAQNGGGSGNFLFDVIRRTADRAARAAGTVYRVVAGTESLDLNDNGSTTSLKVTTKTQPLKQPGLVINNDRTARTINDGLFSGSVQTEQSDERANAPAPDAAAPADPNATRSDGYTEGIPGPVTRLFVLANRGLSNLIQDLILRIAQTSERVVNFKARLITSLI